MRQNEERRWIMTTAQPAATRPAALPVEPSARTYTLSSLVGLVWEGRIRVPHFQRGLRWGTTDAVDLIDSVLRGFPIGSLLLWRRAAPEERLSLGAVTIDAPRLDEALYVVDGQQRITTFCNVFHPVAGLRHPFALVYDIRERPFKVRAARTHESESIPLPTLFDLNRLLRWTRENPQYLELIDEVNGATTRLREFHVPAYEVRSEDDDALRDIYDRMNNAGKRLSRAEAFWGLHAPDEKSAADLTSLATLQEHVQTAMHWGRIDDDTILKIFLVRRGPDITRDIHPEFDGSRRTPSDFPDEDKESAHQAALDALERAVLFLRDEARVPHVTFLPYRYLLVVLARFFAHFPDPSSRNLELLRRWFWRAALIGPGAAKGGTTGVLRLLASCITPGEESDSVQRLLAALASSTIRLPDPSRFRTNHASGHIVLCALWDRGPRSPDDGEPFSQVDLATQLGSESSPGSAVPELFARSRVSNASAVSVGNRILLPGVPVEVLRGLAFGDDLFSESSAPETRSSHFLPEPNRTTDADVVVAGRTSQIGNFLNDFLTRMTGEGLEDTPPLADFDLDDEGASDKDDVIDDVTTWRA